MRSVRRDAWRLASKVQAARHARGFLIRALFGEDGRIVAREVFSDQ
jgi:hypothetical protein